MNPFTKKMLKAILFTADSEVAEKALKGEDTEGSILEATQILKSCRRKVEEKEDEVKVEELMDGFRRWDERTNTSPSCLHIGLYKSLTNPNEQKVEKLTYSRQSLPSSTVP